MVINYRAIKTQQQQQQQQQQQLGACFVYNLQFTLLHYFKHSGHRTTLKPQ
jgi:hypothetical protein